MIRLQQPNERVSEQERVLSIVESELEFIEVSVKMLSGQMTITDLHPLQTAAEPEWNEDTEAWDVLVTVPHSWYVLRTPIEVRGWLHNHVSRLVEV